MPQDSVSIDCGNTKSGIDGTILTPSSESQKFWLIYINRTVQYVESNYLLRKPDLLKWLMDSRLGSLLLLVVGRKLALSGSVETPEKGQQSSVMGIARKSNGNHIKTIDGA